MACMASPELFPAAGSPWIFSDEKPLKRSMRGEPEAQCPEAKEENGHHLAQVVAHMELFQVVGQHAVRGVGLDKDPFDPSGLNKAC